MTKNPRMMIPPTRSTNWITPTQVLALRPAGTHIEPHDEGHENRTEGYRYAGDNVEQRAADAINCTAE